ncbi:hypothetical protein ACIQUM_24090 [Amycolatopsis azurea]|uniref:hypothetical protein n=1 Tax=Amycolatopsis azurea TaxID=36819 RepID=UPI00380F69C5
MVHAELHRHARAPDTDLFLSGPEAIGHDDVAAITGRPVVHRRLSYGPLWGRRQDIRFL